MGGSKVCSWDLKTSGSFLTSSSDRPVATATEPCWQPGLSTTVQMKREPRRVEYRVQGCTAGPAAQ